MSNAMTCLAHAAGYCLLRGDIPAVTLALVLGHSAEGTAAVESALVGWRHSQSVK